MAQTDPGLELKPGERFLTYTSLVVKLCLLKKVLPAHQVIL
eukprot:CAMPEP_0194565156 /NCGR_PEP_ID=MMETSP0292-20121207/4519_1 /TAXON_ID=39354 /ORGANISM="Heterosigma akashiwo, Strain CCMP2393" /LENGTH=40 /DNA_ID= /DNA_START= /DNA_END= /DNA_ORIENTATION=